MKMKALTALWLCFALINQLKAQNENKVLDSIYVIPFTGCKIVLVGDNISHIIKTNNLEILKNKFIQDYRQSTNDKDFPALSKNIVYMASQDGRRRLKAVPEENISFDIKKELKDFKNNLPIYHYTIYDLKQSFTYHIYLNDTADLEALATNNCQKILMDAASKNVKLNRYSIIEIGHADTGFAIQQKERFRTDYLEINAFGGVGLINGSLSPTIGGNIDFGWGKKYQTKDYKIGVGYSFYTFSQLENKSFTNIYPISSYDVHFLFNTNPNTKHQDRWLGLSVGKFASSKIFGGTGSGSLNNAWKAGIVTEFGRMSLQYDFIFDKNKNTNTGITFKYNL